MSKPRSIILTAALPYANGDIHIGHLMEYLMVDIKNRFHKMQGHQSLYVCGDDTHGTPIMVKARQQGISPEELIARCQERHLADFKAFEIAFDHYGSTNSAANREICELVYGRLKESGALERQPTEQFYCEHDRMFLPDRFVKGTCPKCHSPGQYGDNCEVCSATYTPLDLEEPKCSLCASTPIRKASEHLYLNLNRFRDFLGRWIAEHTAGPVANKLKEWLNSELKSWCISRDAPYFGFAIPGETDKFFYVWLDAPLGYLAATKEWCAQNQRNFEALWNDPSTEIYHCIGKDIVYFHCLFFPAMLHAAGFQTAKQVFVHGYVMVNDAKMSKSKGTMIAAQDYLKHLNPSYLRYFYACKINASQDDVAFSFDDFANRVNADLIGKITNVASRAAQMLHKSFEGRLGELDEEGRALVDWAKGLAPEIADLFERMEFAKAMLLVREIADAANRFFDEKKPWLLIKEDTAATQRALTTALNLFRIMAIYLKPVLPSYVQAVETLFQEEKAYDWLALGSTAESKVIAPYVHLLQRIDPAKIEALIKDVGGDPAAGQDDNHAAKEKSEKKQTAAKPAPSSSAQSETPTNEINIEDFTKVELRIGLIQNAETVEGSDKLLALDVSFGALGTRRIFSGIRAKYAPQELIDRKAVFIVNLKPRKMRFGLSQGMLLCSGDDSNLNIIAPWSDSAQPGDRIS